jgi:outer membrane protein assembly factor BamB
VGILDYSRKDTNEFGYTYLKQGNFSKRAEVEAWIYSENIDAIRRVLQDVRGLPIIVDANNSECTGYDSLKIYGFYRDFDIVIQGPTMSRISITFEGLI